MATTLTLEQLVDSGIKHAQHILLKKREKELQPFYTLITDKSEIMVLPCSWRNDAEKDACVAAVKATAMLCSAIKALYIAEAWMLKLPPAATSWHADRQLRNLPRPSESPDRIEVVQIFATDGTTVKSRALQMVRDRPGGKLISLVPLPELEDGDGKHYMGRMVDGLIPPRKEVA